MTFYYSSHWTLCVIDPYASNVYWLDSVGKAVRPHFRKLITT